MPSSPSARLKFEIQAKGENPEAWGEDKLNDALEQLEYGSHGIASVTINGNTTLTSTNYTETNGNAAIVQLAAGTVAADFNLTLTGVEMRRVIENNTSYAATVTESGSTDTVVIPAGDIVDLYSDGSDVYKIADVTQSELDGKLSLSGGTMTGLLTLSGAPTADLHASSKKYVDDTAFAAAELPGQSGNSGKFVTTDGTTASWAFVTFGSLTGTPTTISGYGITDAQAMSSPVAVSSDVTLTSGSIHNVDTTAARALTLPAATEGRWLRVVDDDGNAATNNITVTPDGSDTVMGESSLVIDLDHAAVELYADGSNWVLIG